MPCPAVSFWPCVATPRRWRAVHLLRLEASASCLAYDSCFDQQFEPENGFICLLNHNTQLGDKLGLRSSPADRTIICRHRCARPQGLRAEHLRVPGLGQRTIHVHGANRKLLRARFEFVGAIDIKPRDLPAAALSKWISDSMDQSLTFPSAVPRSDRGARLCWPDRSRRTGPRRSKAAGLPRSPRRARRP